MEADGGSSPPMKTVTTAQSEVSLIFIDVLFAPFASSSFVLLSSLLLRSRSTGGVYLATNGGGIFSWRCSSPPRRVQRPERPAGLSGRSRRQYGDANDEMHDMEIPGGFGVAVSSPAALDM